MEIALRIRGRAVDPDAGHRRDRSEHRRGKRRRRPAWRCGNRSSMCSIESQWIRSERSIVGLETRARRDQGSV